VPLYQHNLQLPAFPVDSIQEVLAEPVHKKSSRKVKVKKNKRKIKSSLMMVKGVRVKDDIKNVEKPKFYQN
jgi:hypothetical protein